MTKPNPTPTQQGNTLERFVLDKSGCVDGGDGCKAEMRHSVAGAFVYHSEIERARAAVVGPRSAVNLQAWTSIDAWLRENPKASAAECLAELVRRIAVETAATASPTAANVQAVADRVNAGIEQMNKSQRVDAATMQVEFNPAPPERTEVAREQADLHEIIEIGQAWLRGRRYEYEDIKKGIATLTTRNHVFGHDCYFKGEVDAIVQPPDDSAIRDEIVPSDSARRAAEEIRNYVDGLICAPPMREFERAEIERIISKHFPVAATSETRLDQAFREAFAAAAADNDAESED